MMSVFHWNESQMNYSLKNSSCLVIILVVVVVTVVVVVVVGMSVFLERFSM